MKKFVSIFLALLIMLSMIPTASAANNEAIVAAETLYALGLFKGTGTNADGTPNFDLNRTPTRHEAVTMLVRLLGKEEEALTGTWETPFADVADWAEPYVGYAYANGLTTGSGATTFHGDLTVTATQYLTFVLRALGYQSGTDFQWDKAWELSDKLGLTDGCYNAATKSFLRGDVAIISVNALGQNLKGGEKILYTSIKEQLEPAVDFYELLETVSTQHRILFENTTSFDGFENYLVDNDAMVNLLTQAEIQSLVHLDDRAGSITYAQAAYDTDVLFRAFRCAYGAYYYFGQDVFDAAEAEVMDWLEGRTTVYCSEFERVLSGAFSFLRDAHTCVGVNLDETDIRYEYYYCVGQSYAKDDEGYYKYIGTEKWYFDCFFDSRVQMVPSLTRAGELVYAPVLFCPAPEMYNSSVQLLNAQGTSTTQTLEWIQSEAYAHSYQNPDFQLLEESGIAYLSVRNFNNSYRDGELAAFVASGAEVKNAKLIIFDIRANGGGSDNFGFDWVENFSGERPVFSRVYSNRVSRLRNAVLERDGYPLDQSEYGTFELHMEQGKQLENQIPIIVLVDDMCGSSGESMLNSLRAMDNVMIVGSNSSGYQLCGNGMSFALPNSNIRFWFGSSLQFWFLPENVDYKGYEPDVWCDPRMSLDAVINLLLRYDLTDIDSWQKLKAALE